MTVKETAKDILTRIKAVFDAPAVAPGDVAPADTSAPGATQVLKTQDGTEITITLKDPATNPQPSVGDAVTIAGAPAPEGVLTLEDGTTITVDATGAIAQLVGPAQAAPVDSAKPPAVPAAPAVPAVPAANSLEQRIAAIEEALTKMNGPKTTTLASQDDLKKITDDYEARIKKSEDTLKGMFELIDLLVKEPSVEPKTLNPAKKERFDKMNAMDEKFRKMADAFKEAKKK